jgi:hypothetical protein
VLRLEIGAVTNDLRSIICSNLERFLAGIGVEYHFPAASEITNNKDCLYEMMKAFHSVYPEQGCSLPSMRCWITCTAGRISTWCWI